MSDSATDSGGGGHFIGKCQQDPAQFPWDKKRFCKMGPTHDHRETKGEQGALVPFHGGKI